MNSGPSTLHTPGFAHYAVAWSPFREALFAISSSANYGLVGNGRLHLVSLALGNGPLPALTLEKQYPTQDGLYDLAWSEIHENQLVTASGDGSLRLWDVTLNVCILLVLDDEKCSLKDSSRIYRFVSGKNIHERLFLSIGQMWRKMSSVRRHGMEQ